MRTALAIVLLTATAGCVSENSQPTAAPMWKTDVAPVVAARCATAGCHAGKSPAGQYDLTSYLGALGDGSDHASNAIAGDSSSAILAVLEAGGDHAAYADVLPLLRGWVVDGRVGYLANSIHPPGMLDPSSDEFHAREIESRDFDLKLCASCHGSDFSGGKAKVACTACHTKPGGPTACDTCHGMPPTTGPHPKHLASGLTCSDCHVVPSKWDDPGHFNPQAKVVLGALAARDLDPPRRTGPPTFDPATATCSNVYCHGGAFGAGAGTHSSPTWTTEGAQTACGGCHGKPPADHAATQVCTPCHAADAPHIDGKVEIGNGSGTCSACHGGATNPAPPRGLAGETPPTDLAVGAHQSHLLAPSGLRPPLTCDDCHVTPTAIDSPGHIDTPLPAEVTLTQGTWDRASATCSGTYCHWAATPKWTNVGRGEAACGTCHPVPETNYPHTPDMTVFDCVNCHPPFSAGKHMDGHVDLQ